MSKAPREYTPWAITFSADEVGTIKDHPLASRILPKVINGSKHAERLSAYYSNYDRFCLTQIGIDGLPVLYKENDEYKAVAGHFSLAAAKRFQLPIVCNVYPRNVLAGISDALIVKNLICMPIFWRLVEKAYLRCPTPRITPTRIRPISYVIASLLEAYCRIDDTIRRGMHPQYLNSYRALSRLGIGSYGLLNGLTGDFGMQGKPGEDFMALGQGKTAELYK